MLSFNGNAARQAALLTLAASQPYGPGGHLRGPPGGASELLQLKGQGATIARKGKGDNER